MRWHKASLTKLPLTPQCKNRFFRLLRKLFILVACGLGYAVFARATGFGIPCPFHALTGLDCPGCGVSRMCLALLRLDIGAAWEANRALLILLPAALLYGIYRAVLYVMRGEVPLSRGENIAFFVTAGALCVFGVLRNII